MQKEKVKTAAHGEKLNDQIEKLDGQVQQLEKEKLEAQEEMLANLEYNKQNAEL